MNATAVMQHATHAQDRPRFFVSTRGVLMDRQGHGPAQRRGYSMAINQATRTEMQVLADLLNQPESMRRFDAGWSPDEAWTDAIEAHERRLRAVASVWGQPLMAAL